MLFMGKNSLDYALWLCMQGLFFKILLRDQYNIFEKRIEEKMKILRKDNIIDSGIQNFEKKQKLTADFGLIAKNRKNFKEKLIFSQGDTKQIPLTESIVIQKNIKTCHFCGSKKQQKKESISIRNLIRKMSQTIAEIKEQYESFGEQMHLFFANFSFILELVGQNIASQTKKRIQKIMEQKNKVIWEQKNKMQKLQEKNMKISARLLQRGPQSNGKKITEIQLSNRLEIQQKRLNDFDAKRENGDQGYKNRLQIIPFKKFESYEEHRSNSLQGSSKNPQHQSQVVINRMKSLDNIKERINKLKNKLKNQKI